MLFAVTEMPRDRSASSKKASFRPRYQASSFSRPSVLSRVLCRTVATLKGGFHLSYR